MRATIGAGPVPDSTAAVSPWPVARRVFPDGAAAGRGWLAGAGGALLLAAAALLWGR